MSDKVPYASDDFMVCGGFEGSGMAGCLDNRGTGIGCGTGPEIDPCTCVLAYMSKYQPEAYKAHYNRHYINYGYDRA